MLQLAPINKNPLKVLVMFILTITFLWKANEAWDKYSRKDTLMVTTLAYPEKQTFPSITICRAIINDTDQQQGGARNMDPWMQYSFQSKSGYVQTNDSGSPWINRYATQILRGIHCFTFTPPNKVTPGTDDILAVYVQANKMDVVTFVLHDEEQNLPLAMNFLDSTGQVLHTPKQDNETHHMVFTISTDIVTRFNTKKAPCYDGKSAKETGLFECLEDHFQKNVGICLMPWNLNREMNSNLSMCNHSTSDQYQHFMNNITRFPTHQNIYRSSGCISSCQSSVYTYETNSDDFVPSEHLSIVLILALKPNGIVMNKEVLVFDALDMVGNIGGYLGLLLEWSLLSLFNIIQNKISKSVNLC